MLKIGLLLLVAPILVLMGAYFMELGDVRDCLLVQEGHWDYRAGICRDTVQPFVPWSERHPWMVNGGMLTSLAGVALCMVGLYVKRR